MKKILLILSSFVFLGIVFFFTEEKKEDLTEIEFWNINPNKIVYSPPKENSELYSKFSLDELVLEKKEIGLKETPIFLIKGKSSKTKEDYTYEANYNFKNFFSEISILKTKGLNAANPELLEKFKIQKNLSPSLKLYNSDKLLKEVFLGEEDKNSNRYLHSDKYLFLTQNYIFQKFTNSLFENRERNYLRSGEFEFGKTIFIKEKLKTSIENQVYSKNGTQVSKWYRTGNGKTRLEPSIGSTVFSNLQNLKADLYPDEEDGQGFEIAKELVKTEAIYSIEVFLSSGVHYILKVFPKVSFKEKTYYPIIKEIDRIGIESVSYTKQESILQLIESFNRVSSANEWNEPKGN